MDYEGLYRDLRVMSRRAIEAGRAAEGRLVDRVWEFENECWMFANELYQRGYGY